MPLTRRECLKQMGSAGLAATLSAGYPSSAGAVDITGAPATQGKPNVVLILADQMSAAIMDCYGGPIPSTPVLSRLASEGVRFTRCYAHSPVCAPNRASIFTGRSAEIHGVLTNNYELPTDNPLMPQVLKTQGYKTGGFGKFHFTSMLLQPPQEMRSYGFDEAVVIEDPRWGPWLDWIAVEHPEWFEQALATCWPLPYRFAYGPDKRDMSIPWAEAVAKHIRPLQEASGWVTMYPSPLPAELHQSTYITDLACRFMGTHLDAQGTDPFFCYVSYVDPHDPYNPPKPYDTLFPPESMPPAIPMVGERYDIGILESQRHNYLRFDEISNQPDKVARMRALYHGTMKMMDEQIGRIVSLLEQRGVLDNTVILFTTDHGDLMGDHGFIAKGVMHYDKGARCPLIARGPEIARGAVSDRLCTSLDIFPTVCDLTTAPERPPLEGKSLAPILHGMEPSSSWPEVTVRFYTAASIITDDNWRFSLFDEPGKGQMFDLTNDPDEQRNEYANPALRDKRQELMERHARAYNQHRMTPQYATYPIIEGKRWRPADNNQIPERPMPW